MKKLTSLLLILALVLGMIPAAGAVSAAPWDTLIPSGHGAPNEPLPISRADIFGRAAQLEESEVNDDFKWADPIGSEDVITAVLDGYDIDIFTFDHVQDGYVLVVAVAATDTLHLALGRLTDTSGYACDEPEYNEELQMYTYAIYAKLPAGTYYLVAEDLYFETEAYAYAVTVQYNQNTHTWDSGKVTTPATCTADGVKTYTCSGCSETKTEPIPATGHDYVVSGSVAPGCETLGYTVYDCGNCGGSKMDDYISKLGHDFKNGICARCSAKEKPIFVDVPAGQYFFDAVKWAAAGGITTGTDETHFSPFLETERCQIVTFLWRAYGKPEPTLTENPFVDVKESDYFYKAVLWAVEKGITTGTDETHFSPFSKCERGQVVTFLWRAENKPEPNSTDTPFEDVNESHYFYKAVLWAVENGITSGADQTHFSPFAITQRCQAVTFLYRALNKN